MKQQASKVKGITVRITDPVVQQWTESKAEKEYMSLNAFFNRMLHQAMNADAAKAGQHVAAD